ncbi:MAG: efflux RND transporter periplasmic adaptor subunit [Bacteroidales bacterium]
MKNNSLNRITSSLTIMLLLFLLVSCTGGKKANPETESEENLPPDIVELRDDQIKLAGIETGTIELRSLSGNLKVNGSVGVSPENLATVCMPFGGFVKSAMLMPGNAVKKGQTLAILENQDFVDVQQNYLEAKSSLEFAEAEFKRHTELYKEDVYSQQNLQKVTAEYKSLKAKVKALEQKLALIGINPANLHEDDISSSVAVVSPISGFVKSVNINIGKYVAPTDVLFEIVNSDKLYLELTLFEKDADKVTAGQRIRFFINNETEQHDAVISQTGRSVSADKTYKVYATVTEQCKNLMPGMYVNATIEASANQVASLPSEAIVSFDDKDYIFVFSRNKEENGKQFTEYRMVEIQKGVTDNGFSEVRLPTGFDLKSSRVVIKGAYNLLSAKKNAGEMSC